MYSTLTQNQVSVAQDILINLQADSTCKDLLQGNHGIKTDLDKLLDPSLSLGEAEAIHRANCRTALKRLFLNNISFIETNHQRFHISKNEFHQANEQLLEQCRQALGVSPADLKQAIEEGIQEKQKQTRLGISRNLVEVQRKWDRQFLYRIGEKCPHIIPYLDENLLPEGLRRKNLEKMCQKAGIPARNLEQFQAMCWQKTIEICQTQPRENTAIKLYEALTGRPASFQSLRAMEIYENSGRRNVDKLREIELIKGLSTFCLYAENAHQDLTSSRSLTLNDSQKEILLKAETALQKIAKAWNQKITVGRPYVMNHNTSAQQIPDVLSQLKAKLEKLSLLAENNPDREPISQVQKEINIVESMQRYQHEIREREFTLGLCLSPITLNYFRERSCQIVEQSLSWIQVLEQQDLTGKDSIRNKLLPNLQKIVEQGAVIEEELTKMRYVAQTKFQIDSNPPTVEFRNIDLELTKARADQVISRMQTAVAQITTSEKVLQQIPERLTLKAPQPSKQSARTKDKGYEM